ncbi:MAG TPA: bifunctional N(6)-L-threonylcarbamoyladenine synthase/serine/threonine protein kinase [Euryarchaeota archaeon]|nr:bifunctional N(6)-L-threonylcarbamoyladenine synthase/serine/threonine protein kinase [Euryarchaeota archaeon]
MNVLGIESTAHTFSVGIVNSEARVISLANSTYRPKQGGIHPREAAQHHATTGPQMVEIALKDSKLDTQDIDLVAFSQGPGLGPCLRTGATMARALSLELDVPLVGVNHCVAHLEVGRGFTRAKDPVLLYVSGGNTQVIAFNHGRYRVMGETLDIGLGNMLDKFGREIGLPFPAGPVLETEAKRAKKFVELPYSVKGMDVAFSGILTAALNLHTRGESVQDLSHSLQETCFAMLAEVAERAMAHLQNDELLLGGGVVMNGRLREMMNIMTTERGAKMYVPEGRLCVDNGAMIAWTGLVMHRNGGVVTNVEDSAIDQRMRTDDVDVTWR